MADIEGELAATLAAPTLAAPATIGLVLKRGGPINEMMRTYGEEFWLQRTGEADVMVYGKRKRGGTEATGNSTRQQQFGVRISTDELADSGWARQEVLATDEIVVDGVHCRALDVRALVNDALVEAFDIEVAG